MEAAIPSMRRIQFRVSKAPRAALALGARSVGHYRFAPGGSEDSRGPKPFIQFFWGIGGTAVFSLGRKKYALGANEIFVYPANSRHRIVAGRDGCEYCWWTLDGPCAEKIVRAFGLAAPGPQSAGPAPLELIERLIEELRDVSIAAELGAGATVYALLSRAAVGAAGAGFKADRTDPAVGECLRVFRDGYTDREMNVNRAAAGLKIHRSALSRKFKAAVGISPVEYLASLRTQRGLSMLKETGLPVKEIAFAVGFSDPNYFSRAIRTATGKSPRDFRRT